MLKLLFRRTLSTSAALPSDEAVLNSMRRLIGLGQAQQAVALFPTLAAFRAPTGLAAAAAAADTQTRAFALLLAALEAGGDVDGLRRVAARVRLLPVARRPALRLALDRARLLVLEAAGRPRAAAAAAAAVAGAPPPPPAAALPPRELLALNLEAVRALLAVRSEDAAFVALSLLQALGDHVLDLDSVAPLVVKTFGILKSHKELSQFLESSESHSALVWAEAVSSCETNSPAQTVAYYRKMLYTLQSASANHVPSANSLSDARKSAQLITATRSVMKTLADFSALETATGLAAEAFAVFRSKSTMDANGLNGALLSQAVQTGYFQVIQSVLANANESTLAKNGTTVIDLLSLATLYIENFLKSDSAIISTQDYATSQEAFKRIFLIYLHCIPLSTAAATISTDQDLKYSAEGAVAFLQKLKEKGYLPELSEYNSLMSLLSKSVIPAPKTLVTFEWPNSQVLPRSKRISHLQQLLQSLQLSGLKPTALTYTHLFNACSADFKHRVPDDWFKSLLFQIKRSNNNSNNNNTKRGSIPHTYGSTKSVLRLHLQRGQTDAFVNLWTEMRNNHSKNINKNHIDGVPPRQWESMVQKTTREIYNIVLKTASSQTSMGAKRFCGWIVTDFMYEMDRDQTVRDDDTWYYLVKCCLVAQDLVNARGIVAAMKEERALQREGGVGGGEKDDLLKASDARIYAVLVRLTFMDSCTAQLFGRDLMLEMHKSGVFGGAIRWEVMRLAIDFYVRAEENRRLLDDDLMESLLELTDFKGIADLGKEIKMKLLEARDSAKR